MHNKKRMQGTRNAVTLILVLSLIVNSPLFSQKFLPAFNTFSGKKEGFLVNMKGDTIKFILDDLDRKKGLIVDVAGKTLDGKKFDYKAQDIKMLAIPPSNYAKVMAVGEATSSIYGATQANYSKINRELVYFFQEYLTDKKITVLLQLVNPEFESEMRVYDDPYERNRSAPGGMGFAAPPPRIISYYVSYNNEVFKVTKSNYRAKFEELFGGCPELVAKYPKGGAWRHFAKHVFFYDRNCK